MDVYVCGRGVAAIRESRSNLLRWKTKWPLTKKIVEVEHSAFKKIGILRWNKVSTFFPHFSGGFILSFLFCLSTPSNSYDIIEISERERESNRNRFCPNYLKLQKLLKLYRESWLTRLNSPLSTFLPVLEKRYTWHRINSILWSTLQIEF